MKALIFIIISVMASGCTHIGPKALKPYERYHLMNRACYRDDVTGVTILLRIGADPLGGRDYGTGDGYGIEYSSHLESAVFSEGDEIEVLKLLLDAGANPNTRGTEGVTPLEFAIQQGKLARADLLIKYGALPAKK